MSRHDNSAHNQRNIILQALRERPQSTNDLRCNYGVMQPAARVLELKAKGYKIDTVTIIEETPYDGIIHRGVAMYVLQSETKSAPIQTTNESAADKAIIPESAVQI